MKTMVYEGLGFPVLLVGVQTETLHGEELPILNHANLERLVFEALLWSPHRLTSSELSFARGYMRKTQANLASAIGLKTHSMISQWENKGQEATGMDTATENAVRTLMANHIGELTRYAPRSLDVLSGKFQAQAPVKINLVA
jgi:hypothetical protein